MGNQVELLAPAGSRASLDAGIKAGADAVYIGGSRFGARYYADNLEKEEMLRAIDYVHLHGRKIYMTVNTLLKDREIEELYSYLQPYYREGLDAVIVQDIGAVCCIREQFPGLSLHISTQAAVTHALGAEFFAGLGADRIVPARELSLDEIRDMKQKSGLEIECFVHGAMCYCYSGQCLLSSMIGSRSGNRGQCAQPCRLPYSADGGKPEDMLSLKDMDAVELIPELVKAGVDSFKIEGRMKRPEYVYAVTGMYRKYIDLYYEKGAGCFQVSREDKNALENVYRRRGYCSGYYQNQNGKHMISLKRPGALFSGREQAVSCQDKALENTEYKIKEKINGKLILSEGNHAKLCMEYTGASRKIYAEYEGPVVQTALRQPLEEERVKRQMKKTGNTEFEFDRLEVFLEGRVFLPMQTLNELRRGGISALEEEILSDFRRDQTCARTMEKEAGKNTVKEASRIVKMQRGGLPQSETAEEKRLHLTVSVQSEEQLKALFYLTGVDTVYIDDSIGFRRDVVCQIRRLQEDGRQIYLSMPYIFRERAVIRYEDIYKELVQVYDGVLIRNWESYIWLLKKGYTKNMISDTNLYVFNQYSKDFMRQTAFAQYTLPQELHAHELAGLGGGGVLIVYGCQPVMISANCIRKTAGRCKGEEGISYLLDRQKKKFGVKNCCRYCYNIMYNCVPLMLLDQTEEIKKVDPAGIRLDFTDEDSKTVRQLTVLYQKAFLEGKPQAVPEMEYTRGHFKRGVK